MNQNPGKIEDSRPAGLLGLAESEAQARLAAEGPNELPQPDRRTPLRIVLEVLREPMCASESRGATKRRMLNSHGSSGGPRCQPRAFGRSIAHDCCCPAGVSAFSARNQPRHPRPGCCLLVTVRSNRRRTIADGNSTVIRSKPGGRGAAILGRDLARQENSKLMQRPMASTVFELAHRARSCRLWRLLSVIVMLVVPTLASAQPSLLSGTIGKAPVLLTLTNDNGRLSGWYVYLRVGKGIRLGGTLNDAGAFTLDEFPLDDPRKKTGVFTGTVTQGRWTGTWRKPEGGSDVTVDLNENHATLADSNINLQCAATRTDKQFGNVSRYALTLGLANGAIRKLSLAQNTVSKSGGDQGCMIGLDDLKPVKSDAGLLLQTDDLAEDRTPRCTIRFIEVGDYLYIQIGDATAGHNDCRGGDEAAYCSPRQFWADMIVNRKSSTCQPVE